MILRRLTALVVCALVFPVISADADDRDLFDEAERRFAAGNYQLAAERFQRLLEDYPGSTYRTQAQLRIAQSDFYQEEYDRALQRLQRTAARARAGALSPTIQLWIGLTAFQMNDYPLSEQALTRHLESASPPQGRAWLYRGLSLVEAGRPAEAREDLRRALDEASGTEQLYAAAVLMELAVQAGEHREVTDIYEAHPVDDHDEAYAEVRIRYAADAALELNNDDRAEELYRHLTAYSIGNAQWAYRQLYALARDREDRSRMQSIYREAEQRLAPEPERLADFWFSLGSDALRRGRFELAELYLSRLWDVRRDRTIDGTAALYLARSMEAQDRSGEALSLVRESLEDSAVNEIAVTERRAMAARLHIRAEEFEAAAEILEEGDVVEATSGTLYSWAYARYRTDHRDDVLKRLTANRTQPLLSEYPPLMRLRGRLYLEAGNPTESVRSYRVYLAERPDDAVARLELVRALVAASQFPAVEQEISRLEDAGLPPGRDQEVQYLRGVAAFHREDYRTTVEALDAVDDTGYEPIRSYHLAWSRYRLGQTAVARETIAAVVDALPADLQADGRYLYAWTLFRGGDLSEARSQLLRILGESLSRGDEVRTRRLLATLHIEEGSYDDALSQYRTLADTAEGTADRVRYEQLIATTLASAGRTEEAVVRYDEIADQFPDTLAGRTALLEAGELLYGMESLRQSRERFREYQSRFPEGPDLDRALYWAGLTSYELDEPGRSLLWWEPLIDRFPRSSYTAEVLFLTAEIYTERDQRRRALELYDRLVAAYPSSREAGEAERLRRTIRLELDGLSAREADLWVQLEPGEGAGPDAGSDRWFDLVLELGRIAIREQISLTRERSRIVDKLLEATEFEGADAAEASLLLAEYYRRRGETNAAVDRYVEAAATNGAPDELRAQSLYELATLARDAGDSRTAQEALEELSARYEGSIWADRAERMMESD
ncbi:MAG: tetratricopeptide repeat protein [Alkalispirochaeta sp.]